MPNNEKLYGEIEPGVFEFRKGAANHNPFARHWAGRYFMIGHITESQIKALHDSELRTGVVHQPAQIKALLNLSVPPPEEGQIKAIEEYLIANMIDEVDRRCSEIQGGESFPWFSLYPHLVRTFGMLHAMDWQLWRDGLPEGVPSVSKVDAVERRYSDP